MTSSLGAMAMFASHSLKLAIIGAAKTLLVIAAIGGVFLALDFLQALIRVKWDSMIQTLTEWNENIAKWFQDLSTKLSELFNEYVYVPLQQLLQMFDHLNLGFDKLISELGQMLGQAISKIPGAEDVGKAIEDSSYNLYSK